MTLFQCFLLFTGLSSSAAFIGAIRSEEFQTSRMLLGGQLVDDAFERDRLAKDAEAMDAMQKKAEEEFSKLRSASSMRKKILHFF